jgi:hypothetical protein
VPKKKWNELSQRTRRLIIVGAMSECFFKIAALLDLVKRPAAQIRGSKAKWAAAIVLTNSVGAVPIAYLVKGRRSDANV